MDIDSSQQPITRPPYYGSSPQKRPRLSVSQDFSNVRRNLRNHGQGILKTHLVRSPSAIRSSPLKALPNLPPRQTADQLLRQYHACFHTAFPILHWPSFTQQYETVYRENSLRNVPMIWSGVLFAVFACGSLKVSLQDGKRYLKTSRDLTDPWAENLDLDHARAALLSSIFLTETNSTSAGWTLMGNAVRVAQDIGLHVETGRQSTMEEEMRRRVWWSIYACDR